MQGVVELQVDPVVHTPPLQTKPVAQSVEMPQ